MKVGIITFHFAHNYGAMLQAHALMQAINQLGHDAKIIDYIPNKLEKEYSMNPFNNKDSIKSFIKSILKMPIRIKQYKLFEDFLKNEMNLTSKVSQYNELNKLSQEFDAIIVGSDQVWNDGITGEIEVYFLNFCEKNTKKISYAASLGTSEASKYIKNCIHKFLPEFDLVTVRENIGRDIILQEINDKSIYQVMDPVFLMDIDYWKDKAQQVTVKRNPYILYYSLQKNPKLEMLTEKAADEYGVEILSIHPLTTRQKINAKQLNNVGPLEFLDLIRNAELVCTNSFHAVAFSIIFKKRLLHIAHSKLNSRVEGLLENLEVEVKVDSDNLKELIITDDMINYDKLVEITDNSREYLMKGLL